MITFIIPAYNEEKRIGKSLSRLTSFLDKNFKSYEIVCVVDGEDGTNNIVRRFMLRNHRIRLLEYEKRLGKGGAMREGVLNSKGDKIIIMDADLPVPLNSIKDFNELLDAYDVVNIKKLYLGYPIYRKVMRVSWILFQKLLFPNIKVSETQGGFKGFKRKVALVLFKNARINGFASDLEILDKASKKNFSIKDYPALFIYREGSTVNKFFDWFFMLIDMIKYKLISLTER